MFAGAGGFGVKDMPSAHSQIMPKKCVTCHMRREEEEKDTPLKSGGHTFRPDDRVCLKCHKAPKALVTKWRAEVLLLLEQLKALLDNASDKKSKRYRDAKLNYDIVTADGGTGKHNPVYARALLQYSISSLMAEPMRER